MFYPLVLEKTQKRKPVASYIQEITDYPHKKMPENVIDIEMWGKWREFIEEQKSILSKKEWKEWLHTRRIKDKGKINWGEWLQKYRIELNAIPIMDFIEWLDEKMARYGEGKILPPEDVIKDAILKGVRQNLTDRIREEMLRKFDIDNLITQECDRILPKGIRYMHDIGNIRSAVRKSMKKEPTALWKTVVDQMAAGIAERVK